MEYKSDIESTQSTKLKPIEIAEAVGIRKKIWSCMKL